MGMSIYSTVHMQVYFIKTIKQPFEQAISVLTSDANKAEKLRALMSLRRVIKAAEGLPEPTKENTNYPNTHVLIDAKDWYFSHFYHEQDRAKMMRAIFNFLIILYQYDEPWRLKIDTVLEFIKNSPWELPAYADKLKHLWTWWREDESKPFPWEYDPVTIGKAVL